MKILYVPSESRNLPFSAEQLASEQNIPWSSARHWTDAIEALLVLEPVILVLEIGLPKELEKFLKLWEWAHLFRKPTSHKYLLLTASKNYRVEDIPNEVDRLIWPFPPRNLGFKLNLLQKLILAQPTEDSLPWALVQTENKVFLKGSPSAKGSWQKVEQGPRTSVRWRWVELEGKKEPGSIQWILDSDQPPIYSPAQNYWSVESMNFALVCVRGEEVLFHQTNERKISSGFHNSVEGFTDQTNSTFAFSLDSSHQKNDSASALLSFPAERMPFSREEDRLSGDSERNGSDRVISVLSPHSHSPFSPLTEQQFSSPSGGKIEPKAGTSTIVAASSNDLRKLEKDASSPTHENKLTPLAAVAEKGLGPPSSKTPLESEREDKASLALKGHEKGLVESNQAIEPKQVEQEKNAFKAKTEEQKEESQSKFSENNEQERKLYKKEVSADEASSGHNLHLGQGLDFSSKGAQWKQESERKAIEAQEQLKDSHPLPPASKIIISEDPVKQRASKPTALNSKTADSKDRAREISEMPIAGEKLDSSHPADQALAQNIFQEQNPAPAKGGKTEPSPVPGKIRAQHELTEEGKKSKKEFLVGEDFGSPLAHSSTFFEQEPVLPKKIKRAAGESDRPEEIAKNKGPMEPKQGATSGLGAVKRLTIVIEAKDLEDRNSSWYRCGEHRVYLSPEQVYRGVKNWKELLPLWAYEGDMSPEFIDHPPSWKFYDKAPVRFNKPETLPPSLAKGLNEMMSKSQSSESADQKTKQAQEGGVLWRIRTRFFKK
jgi:hypothetical protein